MSTIISTAPPNTRAEALTRRAVAMIGIATLAAVAVISFAGFGAQGRSGPLAWSGDHDVFTHPTIPGDRIVTGTLRNDGTHPMRVDIGDVRLLTDDGNVGAGNAKPTSNVLTGLPGCPGSSLFSPGIPTKTASQATCATWDPFTNPDPPGCDWFIRPEEPK